MGVKIKNIWNHHRVLNDVLEYELSSDKSGINITIMRRSFLQNLSQSQKVSNLQPPNQRSIKLLPHLDMSLYGIFQDSWWGHKELSNH